MDGPNPHKLERPGTGTVSRLLGVTGSAPADIAGIAARAAVSIGIAPPAGGTVFRIVEFPPTTDADIAKLDLDFMARQIPHQGPVSSKYRPPTHPFMHRTR